VRKSCDARVIQAIHISKLVGAYCNTPLRF
jgi:hypothetical protein